MDTAIDDDYSGANLLAKYLSTKNRPLRMVLNMAGGATDDVLLPQRIDGYEAICDGIEIRIYCVALDAHLALKDFIGVAVELQIVTDQGNLHSICGIVAEASQGESDGGLASYQLVMRDALAILDLSVNTRVFLNKNELDVVQTVLGEARHNNPALAAMFEFETNAALSLREYPKRQQIIQCNEGTGTFIRRLLRRRGISWYFQPGHAKSTSATSGDASATLSHTMVLFHDARRLKPSMAGTIRFHRNSATEERDIITAWTGVRKLRPGRVTRFSWDYGNPRSLRFMAAEVKTDADQGTKGNQLAATLDHYLVEAPHVRDNYDDLYAMAQQNMARSDFEAKCYYAEGGVRDCRAGEYFSLDGHPDINNHPDAERQFIVLARHITAHNNLPAGLDTRAEGLFARNHWAIDANSAPPASGNWFDSGAIRFLSRLTCVRRDIPFVPAYDPRIDQPHPTLQSVIVVGPPGEEVHCDAQGRVKVRFLAARPSDHEHAQGAGASGTAKDSAWVRVLSPWTGSTSGGAAFLGARFLPRVGTEGLVDFLGGDPDKPVLIGQLYNSVAGSPNLGQADLPGGRYVSGIKSCEIGGRRANQLRLDDTPGQISAQLASDHARSELNLGWLTQPRKQGSGKARGEGAELTTDAQLALRAGKGMLLSAWARLNGGGQQLERSDYLALMEDCLDLFRSLGQYAAEHQAQPSDSEAQGELRTAIKQWDSGSNTAPQGNGGTSAIGITAPAGISFATPKAIVSYAAANIDTVAQQHLQMTAGQRFNVNAGKGVSLFAQQEGLTAIANYGKLLMQSQHDSTQIDSAKDVKVAAKGRVTIMAEEIVLVAAGGAYLHLKGGAPEIGGPGAMTIKTDGHHWNGPASQSAELPTFGAGDFRREPHLVRASDGQPVMDMALHLVRDGEAPVSGTSDAGGIACEVDTNRMQQLGAIFHKPRT